VDDIKQLQRLENTWLLLDDAQNAYDREYDPFWRFVVNGIASAVVDDNMFVVIAATYFHGLEHIDTLPLYYARISVALRRLEDIPRDPSQY
jgi:hypothetical protein